MEVSDVQNILDAIGVGRITQVETKTRGSFLATTPRGQFLLVPRRPLSPRTPSDLVARGVLGESARPIRFDFSDGLRQWSRYEVHRQHRYITIYSLKPIIITRSVNPLPDHGG